ncbi:MAG: ABC transporter ATP-binding protein [Candidatus Peribacteraceae bacterium]|jgi:iron(III) transport system ATP-binding protein|nr:ABC transporter ATP-binding protein [Candidatus Peribacteraceae bacterium]|tara:strand:- start:227 stop:1327 length:1101 start_codon:yes stop_codon:yes gene_type:complete
MNSTLEMSQSEDLMILDLKNVTKSYDDGEAVKKLSFKIRKGETFVILGPSGCGKTTTLRLIAGFEKPNNGKIMIDGEVVASNNLFIPPEKRNVGIVFQEYALFPNLSVRQNISFGLNRLNRAQKEKIIETMLEFVGLKDLAERFPYQLSGGQQQRVALARALAPNPVVILLDEPFSNLDADMRAQMRKETQNILKKTDTTVILVTHDQEEAFAMADRVAVMNAGWIEQIDSPKNIYHFPATRFVADFVGQADFINGVIEKTKIVTEIGIFSNNTALAQGTNVQLMIRPDDIDFILDDKGDAVIEDLEFKGSEILYSLRLMSGKLIHSSRPSALLLEQGTQVRVKVTHPHIVLFRGVKTVQSIVVKE